MGSGRPELGDHPANRVLLDHLRAQARRPSSPAEYTFALAGCRDSQTISKSWIRCRR